MKNQYLLLVIFFLSVTGNTYSQDEKSNWQFGVSIGFNKLRLSKDNVKGLFNESESDIKFGNKRLGFQGNVTTTCDLNRHWQFVTGLGLTQAKVTANRRTSYKNNGLFGSSSGVNTDFVSQKYLLLELPIYFRWQIVALDNENFKGWKPFLDFGFSLKTPLKKETSFSSEQTKTTHSLFGGSNTSSVLIEGTLDVKPASGYFAIGFRMAQHSTITWSFSDIGTSSTKGKSIDFRSPLKSLTISYFF